MVNEDIKKIIVVSDSTGSTANRVLGAVLAQYKKLDISFCVEHIYREVRTRKQVDQILATIDDDYMVVFTIVIEDLRHYFHDKLEERGILHLNVLGPMLRTCKRFLGVVDHYQPGLTVKLDEAYDHRVKAVHFALEHDDGNGLRLKDAELVLVGPSRCGKTPLSMYIASVAGLWVGNIPIVPLETMKADLLRRLKEVDPSKIVGLFISADELLKHRQERSEKLGINSSQVGLGVYHDFSAIRQEIIFCRRLYKKQDWPVIETTRRAYEEVAVEILAAVGFPDIRAIHRT
ncbi:MAG: pyruvate, phosphate dikinase/phosphoenolpyruvate synthase regulator [Patescibacteria group bacterium]|jgi:hypothetical protein